MNVGNQNHQAILRHIAHRVMLERGLLSKGAFWPQIRHLQRLFQSQTGRHDFSDDALYRLVGEWTGVGVGDASQHLGLALRPIYVAVLDFTDAMRQPSALADQA